MKRNDFWLVSLGALQLFLYKELMAVAEVSIMRLAPPAQVTQPLNLIYIFLVGVTLFLLFRNLGSLLKFVSVKDEHITSLVAQMLQWSTIALVCLSILQLLKRV